MLLALTILAFGLLHLVPAIPRAKAAAVASLGKAYGPIYGVASLGLLVLALWAFRSAEGQELYEVPSWGRLANFVLTFLAFLALAVFAFRGKLRNRLRYPMAVAVCFWAAGHLLANGDSRSLVFFGGLALFALLHVFLASRLNEWTPSPERQGHDLLALFFGIAFYGVFAQAHSVVAGVPVLDLIRAGA